VVAAFTTAKHSVVRDGPFNSKSPQVFQDQDIAVPILEPEQDDSPPDDDDDDDDDDLDPICRVVASSDNKLPPTVASTLSTSSKQLLEKIDLLYSKKELRELSYLQPDSMPADARKADVKSMATSNHEDDQETKLISILKRSLNDGGYKLMDKRDLDLCSALNAGYLLRLSLLPDLKNLNCIGKEFYPELQIDGTEDSDPIKQLILDGKVLLFRRGYTKEITTGRLLLPKLDYLQTSLVQRSTGSVTRRLAVLERRLEDFVTNLLTQVNDYVQNVNQLLAQKFSDLVYDALNKVGLSNNTFVAKIMSPRNDTIFTDKTIPNENGSGSQSSNTTAKTTYVRGNKIFKLNRYELGNSFDINDATISPFLLCEMGNETSPVERDIYDAIDAGMIDSASIYESSAVRLLERISIENCVDFFSKKGRRKLVTNYFKYSTLLEPSYEEVVVIWRPSKKKVKKITPPKWMYEAAKIFDMEDRMPLLKNTTKDAEVEMEELEIRAFNDVPMANILAVLPKNKLIFRPADAFVFDFVSLATFLATAGSLKFDSPKLDLLALVSITLFAVRTFFRYSNKYARYDLLVNKFLTSKLSHRNMGALNYLAQEANSQKALRAMCVRDWLRDSEGVSTLINEGETYINDKAFGGSSRVNVDVQAGLDDLRELEQFTSTNELIEDSEAHAVIKRVWDKTFD